MIIFRQLTIFTDMRFACVHDACMVVLIFLFFFGPSQFFIVARGSGNLSLTDAESLSYNTTNPVRRDTLVIPRAYVIPLVVLSCFVDCSVTDLMPCFALLIIYLVHGL
jgi:hypothetical protein